MTGLRILLVTDAVGGVWIYSLELARALKPLGIETLLAVTGPSPTRAQHVEAAGLELIDTGLPLEWLDTSPQEVISAGRALAQMAEREAVDIVQTSSAALLAGVDMALPSVAVQHSCLASWWAAVKGTPCPAEFEWRRHLVHRGLANACAIVAPSLAFAAETSRIYDVPVACVHNGRRSTPPREIPPGEFVFTAGRLWDEGKNIAALDRAAGRLHVPVRAAGPMEGPNGTRIELAHVEALGTLGDTFLSAIYGARPVYASPALYEPFGLSVLEAAQAGCALLLSDIPTYREIWGGAAIFVPPNDDAALAAAVCDLLNDPDEREQLGQLARARAQHYRPERMARGMAHIYASIASPVRTSAEMAGAA